MLRAGTCRGDVDNIPRGIADQIQLPAGDHVELGGHFEGAEQASRTLLILGFVVTVGIYLL
jgi:Cu/Ag efflux pump CusA